MTIRDFFSLPHYSRTTYVAAANIFSGGLLGEASVFAYGYLASGCALIFGMVVGVVFLPLTVEIMRYRRAWIAGGIIYVPTGAVAVAVSYLMAPGASLLITVLCFICMLVLADRALPEIIPPTTLCPNCNYDVRATTTGAAC